MPEYVTKDHFDGAITTIREDIRGAIKQFNETQAEQNERFERRFTEMDRRFGKL